MSLAFFSIQLTALLTASMLKTVHAMNVGPTSLQAFLDKPTKFSGLHTLTLTSRRQICANLVGKSVSQLPALTKLDVNVMLVPPRAPCTWAFRKLRQIRFFPLEGPLTVLPAVRSPYLESFVYCFAAEVAIEQIPDTCVDIYFALQIKDLDDAREQFVRLAEAVERGKWPKLESLTWSIPHEFGSISTLVASSLIKHPRPHLRRLNDHLYIGEHKLAQLRKCHPLLERRRRDDDVQGDDDDAMAASAALWLSERDFD